MAKKILIARIFHLASEARRRRGLRPLRPVQDSFNQNLLL